MLNFPLLFNRRCLMGFLLALLKVFMWWFDWTLRRCFPLSSSCHFSQHCFRDFSSYFASHHRELSFFLQTLIFFNHLKNLHVILFYRRFNFASKSFHNVSVDFFLQEIQSVTSKKKRKLKILFATKFLRKHEKENVFQIWKNTSQSWRDKKKCLFFSKLSSIKLFRVIH